MDERAAAQEDDGKVIVEAARERAGAWTKRVISCYFRLQMAHVTGDPEGRIKGFFWGCGGRGIGHKVMS